MHAVTVHHMWHVQVAAFLQEDLLPASRQRAAYCMSHTMTALCCMSTVSRAISHDPSPEQPPSRIGSDGEAASQRDRQQPTC